MKKYLLLVIIVFVIKIPAIAQISLINSYDIAVYIANIDDYGYKYYGIDYESNQCLIFNTDQTLWKTIDIVPPENSYIDEIAFVSSKLFNNDDNIELLVVFYEYVTTSDTGGYYYYTTKVVNENGVTFLNVPGGGYSTIYSIDKDDSNLLVLVYDFSVSPVDVSTNVYSIPGHSNSINNIDTGIELRNAFPNPANSFINIPFELDKVIKDANIIIYNELGVEVHRKRIDPGSTNYRLNTRLFTSGVYFYSFEADGVVSASRKMIIQ